MIEVTRIVLYRNIGSTRCNVMERLTETLIVSRETNCVEIQRVHEMNLPVTAVSVVSYQPYSASLSHCLNAVPFYLCCYSRIYDGIEIKRSIATTWNRKILQKRITRLSCVKILPLEKYVLCIDKTKLDINFPSSVEDRRVSISSFQERQKS